MVLLGVERYFFIARSRIQADQTLDQGAHAALGLIAMNYDWDWTKAEQEFKQALAISPNDPVTHHWYAECFAAQGRFPEGLSELRLAEESDPGLAGHRQRPRKTFVFQQKV